MTRILISGCLVILCQLQLAADKETFDDWDLVQAYQSSSHIFYGELQKSLPERNFKTGLMGVNLQEISDGELPTRALVWPKAKEFTFSVSERFKGSGADLFVAYLPDPNLKVWTYIETAAGDVFLARPEAINPHFAKLQSGDPGLFFIRTFSGSKIPVLYRARFGQRALDDIALLRPHKAAAGAISLQTIQANARLQQQAEALREAAAFKIFEDEYYKILRIQDLDIRVSLLNDLVVRLGYQGRWTYYAYKERYMRLQGAYLESGTPPPGPTEGREKIWHDISGELDKIEVIQQARESSR